MILLVLTTNTEIQIVYMLHTKGRTEDQKGKWLLQGHTANKKQNGRARSSAHLCF